MLELKLLNTILFSNKESELKIAVTKINNQFEPEKAKNILSYAKAYNNNIPSSLLTEFDALPEIVSDEIIINQFYKSEISPFFGFSRLEQLEEAKKSISQAQINTVKKNYSKLEVKNKELANAKKSNNFSTAQKLEQEIKKIQASLNNLQSQTALKILQHDIAKEQYVKSFKLSKLVADYIEENNTFHVGLKDHLIHKHAYDIIICLGGEVTQNQNIIAKLQNFLSDKGFLRATKPLHDALSDFYLPKNKQNITLKKWQELISQHGKEAMELFPIADRIEVKKAENTEMQNIAPESLNEAILLKAKLHYNNTAESPELAELALKYALSETKFNKCLELEKQKKAFDNLPDIIVHGKDIDYKLKNGSSLNGYHLTKLPIDDPRAYILGHIVKDCQSIGGHSERCVIDGITRENNGFYVFLKNKSSAKQNSEIFSSEKKIDHKNLEIIGQSYSWLSEAGNLSLDSWENLRNEDAKTGVLNDDEIIIPILQEFAKQICTTTDIDRVVVGIGGKTPKKFKELKIKCPEIMLEGYSYGDAKEQALIWQKPELTELENKINSYVTKVEYKFELNRIDRAKALLDLIENDANFNDLLNNSNPALLTLLNLSVTSTDLKNFNYNYFKELSNLDLNVIKQPTDSRALEGYSKKFFTLEKLKDLPLDKIKIFLRSSTFDGFKENIFTFDDLKDFSKDKISILVSSKVINGYKENYCTFYDLKDLSINIIQTLTSEDALDGYKSTSLNFKDFKEKLVEMEITTAINENHETFSFNDFVVNNHNHEEIVETLGKDL